MSEVTHFKFFDDHDLLLKEFERALVTINQSYLTKEENIKEIFQDNNIIVGIYFLRDALLEEWLKFTEKIENLFEKYNFFEILMKLFKYLSNVYEKIDFTSVNKRESKTFDCSAELNERHVLLFSIVIKLFNWLLTVSSKLGKYLVQKEHLEVFIGLIKNERLASEENKSTEFIESRRSIIFVLNWLSKISFLNKDEWKELNAFNILTEFSKTTPGQTYLIFVYMCMINIGDDKEIENLDEIHTVIYQNLYYLQFSVDLIIEDPSLRRFKQMFILDEKTSMECDVAAIMLNKENLYVTVNLTGILMAFYNLCVNDKLRAMLSEESNFFDCLWNLINKGSEIEILYTLEIYAQLCFNKDIASKLRNNNEFIKYIDVLIANDQLKIKKIKRTCEQIKWVLFNEEKQTSNIEIDHLMISYNTESREMCLKIKEFLERNGFKVWIDVEQIHGSSLDAMANAVEKASIVLLCITEKYRQSLYCQSEAQYSFRLNKKIIPLILQKGMQNVTGWLGIIISDKIFVDFTKYELTTALDRLSRQLNLLLTKNTNTDITIKKLEENLAASSEPLNKTKSIETWSFEQVNTWFNEKINQDIIGLISPCNGESLVQLYNLQTHAPEFFYKSITKLENIGINDVTNFSVYLKNLFKDG